MRALSNNAERLRREGLDVEQIARILVERRNEMKRAYRAGLGPELLATLESRNQAKYGDPLGPTPAQLLQRYGNWDAVIAAAARPAKFLDL